MLPRASRGDVHGSIGAVHRWSWLLVIVAFAWTSMVRADDVMAESHDDFATSNRDWNGTSGLIGLAEDEGIRVFIVDELDMAELGPVDGLLIVHPETELPAEELSAFMRAGGRVALADDFGTGRDVLRHFGITRGQPNLEGPDVTMLRGNPQLLLANAVSGHPLAAGVDTLLTNHPQVVFHRELVPIFAFGMRNPVVVAGAVASVEEGRLVAIGDPSILINNMLELGGNRAFARNLVRYLARRELATDANGDEPRLFVLEHGGTIVGRYGEPGANRPLHDLRAGLEQLAALDLPPPALRVATFALVLVVLILAGSSLPRTSPYASESMFRVTPHYGGFAGRLAWHSRASEFSDPLIAYRMELEHELATTAGVNVRSMSSSEVEARLGRRLPKAEAAELASILRSLDDLDAGTRLVGREAFLETIDRAERVMSLLRSRR